MQPEPECGLVISYSYLWRNEHGAGKLEGLKNRPCGIILVIENDDGSKKVTVAPLTHATPQNLSVALEIPPKAKQHLGLDGERSWIILDYFNVFLWPGYDLRPIPGKTGKYDYGFLPPALFKKIATKIIELRQQGMSIISRD
jgi:hypothetical protein